MFIINPIMEFTSLKQAYDCLREWQETLFLQDWIVKLLIDVEPDDMTLEEVCGENVFSMEHRSCVIKILKPEFYGDRILKYCAEEILIHELLHCKYNWTRKNSDSIEYAYYDVLEHSLIEQMARSLLMAKYHLKPDWFKNFESPDLQ